MNGELHDSGERRKFGTGATRDASTEKPRVDLISPFAQERHGEHLRKGSLKYPDPPRNWELGMPFSECVASLERHIQSYKAGRTKEDHLAAIMCNAGFLAHYEHEIEAGRLPASLNDLPRYEQRRSGFSMTFEKCAASPGPDIASQQAPEPVDDSPLTLADLRGKPTWTQCTGEYTADLRRLRDAWHKMTFVAPFLSRADLIAVAESFQGYSDLVDLNGTFLCFPAKKLLPADPDRVQHETFLLTQKIAEANARSSTPWMDKFCRYMNDAQLMAFADEIQTYLDSLTDEERIAAAQDSEAVPVDTVPVNPTASGIPVHHPLDLTIIAAVQAGDAVPGPKKPTGITNDQLRELIETTLEYAPAGVKAAYEACRHERAEANAPADAFGANYWLKPRRPRAYLAGPMRGYKMFNWPAFKLATELWAIRGYDILSPADADDREDGLYPMDDPERAEARVAEYGPEMVDKIIRRDVEAIMGLDSEKGDCLILLPGWERSTGAQAERALARWRGLTCYDALDGRVVEN